MWSAIQIRGGPLIPNIIIDESRFFKDQTSCASLVISRSVYTVLLQIGAVALSSDQILDGTGQIWLEDVHCAGTESRLINCPSSPIGSQNCNHNNDVGVICQPSTPGK